MRISTKGRHAVMAMVDLACHGGEKPVPLAEVAQRQKISLSYLEQLIAKLKRSGLVKSTRGPGGGYVVAQSHDVITVFQIVSAVDTGPAREKDLAQTDAQSARKLTDHLWQQMNEQVQKYLKSITLDAVVRHKI